MRATVHVIPCAGVLQAAGDTNRSAGSGIAFEAIRTAERLEEPADLVLLAVPAGHGAEVARRLLASDRGPAAPRPRPRYLSERDLSDEELDDLVGDGAAGRAASSIAPRGRNRGGPSHDRT
jgi:hypothetical protein